MSTLETRIILLLRAGVLAAFFLLALGLLLVGLGGAATAPGLEGLAAWYTTASLVPADGLPARLLALDGGAFLTLGLFVLILTPFLRVALSLHQFLQAKDRPFPALTLAVLLILVLSLFLGATAQH